MIITLENSPAAAMSALWDDIVQSCVDTESPARFTREMIHAMRIPGIQRVPRPILIYREPTNDHNT